MGSDFQPTIPREPLKLERFEKKPNCVSSNSLSTGSDTYSYTKATSQTTLGFLKQVSLAVSPAHYFTICFKQIQTDRESISSYTFVSLLQHSNAARHGGRIEVYGTSRRVILRNPDCVEFNDFMYYNIIGRITLLELP